MQVVWNGTLEREAARAEQRAPSTLDEVLREVHNGNPLSVPAAVFAYLRTHPGSTPLEVARGLGIFPSAANGGLGTLSKQGRVRALEGTGHLRCTGGGKVAKRFVVVE